ncbi:MULTISPECIES: EAL domain-containing protein [unclassified Wenzhouxiangella]|uniref:EAL domain-containing protein n=1 Tax=unclassified Wenzhouxiangella TaxID=2613841 RepID=UPI000E326406|nr:MULTISPECIES: EAL domain-containing protein [unclassified Wenzhouxiangella]RFF27418.1 EAL domain-containing protein [Wenzhouxiangella sp. 15181]RFP68846.1 EAL domain-containing protein [Wenzhouxiangella sp. 15190]
MPGFDNSDINTRLDDYLGVLDVGIRFAFQPLVDEASGGVVGHEALVRGCRGESPAQILASVRPENLFYFDQACRLGAIHEASRLGLTGDLHINCTEVDPENLESALTSTAEAVRASRFEPQQIVLEFNSLERLGSPRQLARVRARANDFGFRVAADNFGTGEAGLKRLAVLRPEYVKLDRELIAGIHGSLRRQAMVLGVLASCKVLGIQAIAAGIENEAELAWLRRAGVGQFQGYYFGRPELVEMDEAENDFLRAGEPALELSACAA